MHGNGVSKMKGASLSASDCRDGRNLIIWHLGQIRRMQTPLNLAAVLLVFGLPVNGLPERPLIISDTFRQQTQRFGHGVSGVWLAGSRRHQLPPADFVNAGF